MRCPSCGFENPTGMKFCGQCATPLTGPCPACGYANPPGFAFCGQCAAPLTAGPTASRQQAPLRYTPRHLAERILTAKAALEGERKQVTVLFADLKGSMELLAERDPEDARAILDPVLEHMMAAVHRYEGTVNQVMGDGIMALFGAPIAHEDHAVRACYAALAMQTAIRRYQDAAGVSAAAGRGEAVCAHRAAVHGGDSGDVAGCAHGPAGSTQHRQGGGPAGAGVCL
jgi:class 3 adenylate cyclase